MKFPSPSEDQAKIVWTAATALGVTVILVLVAAIFVGMGWMAKQLSSVLLPLAIAGVIAYLLDPVVDFFQKRGIARSWAIILVFFLAVLFQVGMVGTVVPRLLKDTRVLKAEWPDFKDRLQNRVDGFLHDNPFSVEASDILKKFKMPEMVSRLFEDEPQKKEASDESVGGTTNPQGEGPGGKGQELSGVSLEEEPDSSSPTAIPFDGIEKVWAIVEPIISQMGQLFVDSIGRIGSLLGLLAGLALIPVYVFYFLAEKKGIQDSWTDYLPIHESKMKVEIVFVLRSINDSLIVFFRSQVLVAMCVGGLLMIGFSIIGLRYGVLLGFIAGILGIVPYLGVMLSIVPAVTISIIQSSGILHPLLTLGVFGIVQLLEGLVISPKIIGDRVGLHPLTVIVSIMIGTTLFGGITGGVLAIPLTAALRTLMFRYVWRRRAWEGFDHPMLEAEETASEVDNRDAVGKEGSKG
ncbi:MAG: AI-2E family transporter [Verrucomicrobia bacterium]|nr:AI-2E family transporter [Verrucomicrobiota bacterium]